MMSMASGKSEVNFLMRRLAMNPTTQRGRPKPLAKARPSAINGEGRRIIVTPNTSTPTTALITQKV